MKEFTKEEFYEQLKIDAAEEAFREREEVTRIEVIGTNGREFSKWLKDSHYEVSIQDDGRTMKIFETEKEDGTDISGVIGDNSESIRSVSYSKSDREVQRLNNFQDFNFTADFDGEILKEVDGRYVGYYIDSNIGYINGCTWLDDGGCWLDDANHSKYNLTPIKKAWYEYRENFPALLTSEYKGFRKTTSKEHFIKLRRQGWKLATKEDVNSLYCEVYEV